MGFRYFTPPVDKNSRGWIRLCHLHVDPNPLLGLHSPPSHNSWHFWENYTFFISFSFDRFTVFAILSHQKATWMPSDLASQIESFECCTFSSKLFLWGGGQSSEKAWYFRKWYYSRSSIISHPIIWRPNLSSYYLTQFRIIWCMM